MPYTVQAWLGQLKATGSRKAMQNSEGSWLRGNINITAQLKAVDFQYPIKQ